MRQIPYMFILCVAVVLAASSLWAADASMPAPTVEAQYFGLSSGPLRQATLVTLPKGILLRAGALTITEKQLAAEMAKATPDVQAQLEQHQFFLLEQLSLKSLLLAEARTWAIAEKQDAKENDDALIRAYLQSVAKQATVSDAELKAFYAANTAMLGGAAYETVVNDLRSYLLEEKQQALVAVHLNTMSMRTVVEIDATWTKTTATRSLDTSVDKARRAGKPALIDFGADGCGPCDMMAPILDSLHQTYEDQCTVLFVDVRAEQILAARYGIQGIPVQVFFDTNGKEVFRHVGFFPKENILAQLAALGVK